MSSEIFKKYFLMMPQVLVVFIFTNFINCVWRNFDHTGRIGWDKQLERRNFGRTVYAAVIGVWKGDKYAIINWNPYTWILHIELLGSMLVYGVTVVIQRYRNKNVCYAILVLFFWLRIEQKSEDYYTTSMDFERNTIFFPFFIIGTWLSDLYV